MADSEITYHKLNVSSVDAENIMEKLRFHVSDGMEWYAYRIPYPTEKDKEKFEHYLGENNGILQPYFPVEEYVDPKKKGKTVIRRKRPKILNYMFVLGKLFDINEFGRMTDVYPIARHREKGQILSANKHWLTIPMEQMRLLMLVTEEYETEVEFVVPEEQQLEKGDKVFVVEGPYKGVEGILVSNQGSHKGGRLVINITSELWVKTLHIPDQHIQVLEFSRESNHWTRQMQSVENMFDRFIELRRQGIDLSQEQQAALRMFLFRYERLGNLTHLNRAKLAIYQYVANKMLNRRKEAAQCLLLYRHNLYKDASSRLATRRTPALKQQFEIWNNKMKKK